MKEMKALLFQVRGAMGHFRKVFSNSTSLSYYFPPRTTVMGMIAAAMGKERDRYYEELNQYEYSVSPLTGLRKLMFGETYLDTDNVDITSLRRLKQGVPTGREFVVPAGEEFLGYEVLVYPFNEIMMRNLRAPAYPISLGPANMLGWIEQVEEIQCEEFNSISGKVNSVSSLKPEIEEDIRIAIEEMVPRAFDAGRHSGPLSTYFLEIRGKPITVKGPAKGVRCKERNYLFL